MKFQKVNEEGLKAQEGGLFNTGSEPQQVEEMMASEPQQPEVERVVENTGYQGGRIETNRPIGGNRFDRQYDQQPAPGTDLRKIIYGSRNRRLLSVDGQLYLNTVKDNLEKEHGMGVISAPNDGTYLATDGTAAIGLVFNEIMSQPSQDNDFIPACAHLDRIVRDDMFQSVLEQNNLTVDSMVIIPVSDYRNENDASSHLAQVVGRNAANCIKNSIALSTGADLTVEELSRYPIRINMNPADVAQYLEENCSSGVLPYYQIGCAVEICLEPNNPNQNREWTFLAMIGVTTEFIDTKVDDNQARFVPMVTITACESTVRSIKMLPIILGIAEEVFIAQQYYLEPFRNWGEGNPNMNLGSLLFDEQSKLPAILNTMEEYNKFLFRAVDYPVLAADVRFGAWNHPALAVLMEPGFQTLYEELNELDPTTQIGMPVSSHFNFYSGTVRDDKTILDTRAIDYFRVVNSFQDNELLEAFRGYTDDPTDRLRAISEAGWKNSPASARGQNYKVLESLYDTHRFIMDSNALVDMMQILNQLDIIRNLRISSGLAFDIGQLRSNARVLHQRDSMLIGSRQSRSFPSYGRYYRR